MRPEPPEGSPVDRSDPAEEVAVQEALLAAGMPWVRVAIAGSAAISYGVGEATDAPYLRRARADGLATVARSTGGSGVLHLAGDLFWALVLPRDDERVGRDFARAYGRLGAGIVRGLGTLGLSAAWLPAPGLDETYCPLSSRGEVLSVEDRIVGGAAQHLTGRGLLHHGFVAWQVDRPTIERLFDLPAGGPATRLGGIAEIAPGLAGRRLAAAVHAGLRAMVPD